MTETPVQNAVTVRMPPLHPGQKEVLADPARFKVLACGRRWGKTRLGASVCLATAVQGGVAWWVAPTYPVASVGWRLLQRLCRQIPGTRSNQVDRMITMPSGGWLQVRSADDPDSLRGEGLDFVVVDEAAFVQERAWAEALRPALSDKRGGALIVSTPKGRNWFYRAWLRGQDTEDAEWASWQKPSTDNPFVRPEEIEQAKAETSERVARQEYDAEFLDDGGEVFRNVRTLSTGLPLEAPIEGRVYVAGLDLARKQDFTVLKVFDVTDVGKKNEDGVEGIAVEVVMDRFNQVHWSTQIGRVRAVVERFGVRTLRVDATGVGDPIVQDLDKALQATRVDPFIFTAASRHQLLDNLALLYEKQTIRALYDETSIGEKEMFVVTRTHGGSEKYAVADGAHDDTVFAEGLALWGLARPKPKMEILGWTG